jgi:hypothetical protein
MLINVVELNGNFSERGQMSVNAVVDMTFLLC